MAGDIERILKALEEYRDARNILKDEVVHRDSRIQQAYTEMAEHAKAELVQALDAYIDTRIQAMLDKRQQRAG